MTRMPILVPDFGMEVVMAPEIGLRQKKNVRKPVFMDEQVSHICAGGYPHKSF